MAFLLFIAMLFPGTGLTDAAIQQSIRQFVEARLASQPGSAEIEFRSMPAIAAAVREGAAVRVVEDDRLVLRGAVTMMVEILHGSTVVQRAAVSLRVRIYDSVAVARTQLAYHKRLDRNDCAVRVMETTDLPRTYLRTPAAADGMRTNRLIGEGTIMRMDMVEAVPVILQGQQVLLRVVGSHMLLSAAVEATEDGVVGKPITVRRLDSRERLRARVVDAKTVELRFE